MSTLTPTGRKGSRKEANHAGTCEPCSPTKTAVVFTPLLIVLMGVDNNTMEIA